MKFCLLQIAVVLILFGSVSFPAATREFNPHQGSFEVWVQPSFGHLDADTMDTSHNVIFYWGPEVWRNELRFFVYGRHQVSARWVANGRVQSTGTQASTADWEIDAWRYLVLTWDADSGVSRLYVDGEMMAELENWVPPSGQAPHYVGMAAEGVTPFSGDVDRFQLFDRVLGGEEIRGRFVAAQEEHAAALVVSLHEPKEQDVSRAWYDNFPIWVWTNSRPVAERFNADMAKTAVADNPGWGLLGQANRLRNSASILRQFEGSDIRHTTWFETFGQVENIFLAELARDGAGEWRRDSQGITQLLSTHWHWQLGGDRYGGGPRRWIDAHGYFDDLDFHQPLTLTHERYGAPPMRYPDGTIASGFFDDQYMDPSKSRIYDAGGAKNIFGELWAYDLGYSDGELTWTSFGKDIACPSWIDYNRAALLFAIDAGVDAIWSDNYNAFDSFHYPPINRAFGDWSEATFLDYLAANFAAEELREMGIDDLKAFNIRAYLIETAEAWAQGPVTTTDHWVWRVAQWIDDPLWRAYMIHKRQMGTLGFRNYYQMVRETATAAGKDDLLLMGNGLPRYNLGWLRGDLDMVSTEMNDGWHMSTGSRGIMLPPLGRYAPIYKLGREHAQSRFVNVWMYMAREPEMSQVLFYEGLANHALPKIEPKDHNQPFTEFVSNSRSVWGGRVPFEEVGIFYSSSSELTVMTPGGFLDMDRQPHMQAHYGWGTALEELHYQYRSVPEWKLEEILPSLAMLIIPDAQVFCPQDVEHVLQPWVEAGGVLIVTGESGVRLGEQYNFNYNPDGLSLAALTGVLHLEDAPSRSLRPVGDGAVLFVKDNVGLRYYADQGQRLGLLGQMAEIVLEALSAVDFVRVIEPLRVPRVVGLTMHVDEAARRVFVDANNMAINPSADRVTPTQPISFQVTLPAWATGSQCTIWLLSPQEDVELDWSWVDEGRIQVEVGSFLHYVSIVIDVEAEDVTGG